MRRGAPAGEPGLTGAERPLWTDGELGLAVLLLLLTVLDVTEVITDEHA
jgi:hypothetical protein